jgi:hypothetical protein
MAVAGCLIVILGWKLGGAMGGTAAAVYALTSAIYGSNELQERRSRIAQRATAEVANLEAALGEIVAQEEVFCRLEEYTGERDEPRSAGEPN